MSVYLDASVVIPALVEESASPEVGRFLNGAEEPLIVSEFTAV